MQWQTPWVKNMSLRGELKYSLITVETTISGTMVPFPGFPGVPVNQKFDAGYSSFSIGGAAVWAF